MSQLISRHSSLNTDKASSVPGKCLVSISHQDNLLEHEIQKEFIPKHLRILLNALNFLAQISQEPTFKLYFESKE